MLLCQMNTCLLGIRLKYMGADKLLTALLLLLLHN